MNVHTPPPEEPQDGLYRRTDLSPEQFFQALGRVRRAARDEIERLIIWLDSTIDTDEDTAADDDPCDDIELEPSLGSFDRMSDQIKAWSATTDYGNSYDTDAELDRCDDEDNGDREPSLGFSEPILTGAEHDFWFPYYSKDAAQHADGGSGDDREGDPGCDDAEPSLCGLTANPTPMHGDGRFPLDAEEEQDDEPSLGSLTSHGDGDQAAWAFRGAGDVDAEEEHDGREPDDKEGGDGAREDDEPTLGWTVNGQYGSTSAERDDCEVGGSVAADDQTQWVGSGGPDTGMPRAKVKAMRKRYVKNAYGMHPAAPNDGKHVDAEPGYGKWKRLRNLSNRQKEIVKPRLDRDAVMLT